jgi:DNA-directed RNA polymerase subunit RPC12/RpoP
LEGVINMKCPKCGKELEVVDDIGTTATNVIGLKCDECKTSILLIGPIKYLRDLILDGGGQDDA